MKKRNKILSLCLGLVLALGVTACDDILDEIIEDKGDESGEVSQGEEQPSEEPESILITSISFDSPAYSVVVGESVSYSVSVEPDDATNKNYSIGFYTIETHVVTTSIATTSEAGASIVGLSAGECYIVATALDGSGVYGYASVTVNAKETPITALRLSQEEITIDAGASFTISSVVGSDVVVTPDPVNADNPAWTIKEDGTSYLTISTRGTDNSYTVTSSEEGAGNTASLVLTAEADSQVTATLTVHISEVVADTHPVTDITLTKDGASISELTLTSGEELTIGAVDSNADIIVEISPANADEVGFTVSSENSDIVTISGPNQDTGIVTVTALDNTSWTADKEATITVTTVGKNASGAALSATLKVVVPRPVEYVNKLEVTPKSISLVSNEEILLTSLDGFSVTIYNQYNEVMNGVGWTASVTSGESYLTLSGSSSTDYTIKVVSAGSATITITAYGTEIKDTIAVSITDKVYEVTTIEMDANQYNLGYGQGGETSQDYPASIDLAQHVKYINSEEGSGGLASSSQYGVTAEITSGESYITLDGTVVTAIGVGSATVTLTSITNTQASIVANIVVNDITDYTPTGITCSTTPLTVSNGSTTTLSEAITGVTISPSYASQDYVVMVASGSESYLSISEGVLSATNTTNNDVTGTLLIYPLYNDEAYTDVTPAMITVIVTTDYVAVTEINVAANIPSSIDEDETIDLGEYITIVPDTATNKEFTVESSNPANISVSGTKITGVLATSTPVTLTISAADNVSKTISMTVESVDKSVTLNVYFVGDSSSPSYTYYGLPNFTDTKIDEAYLGQTVAYLVTIDDDGNWNNPHEADGYHQLNAVSSNPADGYTVDLGTEYSAGTVKCLIYFEFASDAANGESETISDWNYHYPSDTNSPITFTISEEVASKGGSTSLYVSCDPSDIITPPSDSDFIDVVIGLYDTGTGSHNATFCLEGGTSSWSYGTFSTYTGTHSSQIHECYTYSRINKTSDKLEFVICSGATYDYGNGLGNSATIDWTPSNYYLYCTSNAGPTWGLNFGDLYLAAPNQLSGVSTLYVILSFEFSSFSKVSAVSFITE